MGDDNPELLFIQEYIKLLEEEVKDKYRKVK